MKTYSSRSSNNIDIIDAWHEEPPARIPHTFFGPLPQPDEEGDEPPSGLAPQTTDFILPTSEDGTAYLLGPVATLGATWVT